MEIAMKTSETEKPAGRPRASPMIQQWRARAHLALRLTSDAGLETSGPPWLVAMITVIAAAVFLIRHFG